MTKSKTDELSSSIQYRLIEDLSAAEKRYLELIENLNDIFFKCDKNGKLKFLNPAWSEILGYSIEDSLLRNIADFLHPDDREKGFKLLAGKIKKKWKELRFCHFNGEIVWLELAIFKSESENKLGLLHDITERKYAAEALKAAERLFSYYVDTIDAFVYIKDRKSNYTFLNKKAEKLLNIKREELKKRKYNDSDFFDKKTARKIKANDKLVMDSGESIEIEESTGIEDTKQAYYLTLKFPLKDENGNIIGLCGFSYNITKAKHTERALKESEDKFRSYIESSPVAVFVVDKSGKYIDANPAACSMLNYSRKKLLQMGVSDLIGPEESDRALAEFRSLIKTGTLEAEYELKKKDGSYVPVYLKAVDIPKYGYVAYCNDITERKQAAEALKESEERYRNLVETSQDLLWRADNKGRFIYINPAWEKTVGYKVEEMLGRCFTEFKTPEQAKKDLKIFKSTLEGKKLFGYETTYISKSGEPVHLVFKARTLKDTKGNVIGTQGTAYDITERKQVENTLLLFRNLMNQYNDAVFVTDAKTSRFLDVNQKACSILGYTRQELLSLGVLDIETSLPDDVAWNNHTEQLQKNGHVVMEGEHKRKDGTTFPVEVSVKHIVQDESDYVVAAVRDITERKQAEEEIKKLNSELEQRVNDRTTELEQTHEQLLHAEKLGAIGKLSASIAHEFNNPLFGIRNVLDGILRKTSLDKKNIEFVNMAIKESDRIASLIRSLQDFNRPTSGVMEAFDIHQALDDIILLVKKELKTKNIKLRRSYAADMPKVKAVEDQIKQVILNVLNNAGEAITGKGGTIKVSTKVRSKVLKEKVAIQIQDTGVGIKPEHMDKIFEPFFTTKSAVKGSGLGLSVSYGIIKKHGGEIKVKSEPGKGTTFTIILPKE